MFRILLIMLLLCPPVWAKEPPWPHGPKMLLITVRIGAETVIRHRDQVFHTADRHRENRSQQIRVQAGHKASIRFGEAIPVAELSDATSDLRAGVTYRDVLTGFTVLPKLVGRQVQLQIKQQREHLSREGGQHITKQTVSTVLTVPFATWIKLADTRYHERSHQNSVIYTTSNHERADEAIYVRVDDVTPTLY